MKPVHHPRFGVRARALSLILSVGAAVSATAQPKVIEFDSGAYIQQGATAGDLELARTAKPARSATHTLYPFGPAKPDFDYSGPAFSLGYEVKASAPSDLTVAPDKAVVEDNFPNGEGRSNDTVTITAYGDWPEANTYSVAAVVVFAAATPFILDALGYSALNWTENKSYNDKLRHRWVVQAGGKYYVNTGFLGRTGVRSEKGVLDVIRGLRSAGNFDQWVEYDPTVSIFANFEAPRVKLGDTLDHVSAAGFYMDARDFTGAGKGKRQWQLRLVTFAAAGAP